MRILILNWRDPTHPQAGGCEEYLRALSVIWISQKHEVTWFCGTYPGCKKQEVLAGVHIQRKGGKYGVYLWTALKVLIQSKKYDIILDCENGIPFFSPLFAPLKSKILIVHHVHIEVFHKEMKFPLNWIGVFLESKLMSLLYRSIHCITVSPSSLEELITLGFKKRNLSIIYNGVELSLHSVISPKGQKDEPFILYLGRVKKYKSIETLLLAFFLIHERFPNLKLVIAGRGDYISVLKEIIKTKNLENKVKFLGYVSEEQKIALLQKTIVMIQPSQKEGWGVVVIEANACGTPCIAANVPGLRDSVVDGVTGLLFRYGDPHSLAEKLEQILSSVSLREQLSEKALTWSEKFRWEKSAEKAMYIVKREITKKYS